MYLYKYTLKSKQTRIIKNLKTEYGLITSTKSKETRNNILTWDIFKSLIPTYGKHSLIMLTHRNGPKVGIKFLKISHVRILFLVSYFL